jgi:3'(2'), 5'-bisphosphate nucleotidase
MMPGMGFDLQRLPGLLRGASEVARAAGREIMRVYAQDFAVEEKADHSPLTEADLASQRVITAGLTALAPDIPVLGEESAPADIATRLDWPTLWLIDPLDGTREFVKRNGEFAVNIALIHNHEPLLGVIYAPVHNDLYAGHRGALALHVRADGSQQRLQAARSAAAKPRVLASRSHRGHSLDALLERLGPCELIAAGSSLKFGVLAGGGADLYPRFSPTSEWDTAAGQAILEAAGARLVGLDGLPLRYNQRDTLINPSFLAWADDTRDWLKLANGS